MTWRDPLVVVLLCLCGWLALRPAPNPPPDPDAPLRTEVLKETLEDRGFVVVEGQEHEDLLSDVVDLEEANSRLDSARAELVRQVRVLDAELRASADLTASVRARFDSLEATTVRTEPGTESPSYLSTAFDDGVFSGVVGYQPAGHIFDVDVAAEIRMGLNVIEGADRRLLFSAVAEDPRVGLILADASYQLPEPIRVCSWGERGRWAVGGAGGLALLELIFGR